jgi:diguanylate cyclase (GGDEF)-like protein/PAS domain S-box-containing protein
MNLQNTSFVLLLILSIIFSIVFTVVSFRSRKTLSGGFALFFVGLGIFIGSGAYLVEIFMQTLPAKLFWANIRQLGFVILPAALLFFALRYSQLLKGPGKGLLFLLCLEPITVLSLFWLGSGSALMRINPHLIQMNGLSFLSFEFGPRMFLHFAYSAALNISAVVILLYQYFRSDQFFRKQIAFLLLGMSIPFLGSIATILGIFPPQLNIMPLLLGLSFPIMALGLFRSEFFKMSPVDNQIILNTIPMGIVVLDLTTAERINGLNPAACQILGATSKELLGKPLHNFLPEWQFSPAAEDTIYRFEISRNDRVFSVYCDRISMPRSPLRLWLVLFQDFTDKHKLERSLESSEEKYRTLVEHSLDGIGIIRNRTIQYCNQQMAAMVGYKPEELLNTNYDKLLTKETIQQEKYRHHQRLKGETPPPVYESSVIHRNKHIVDVEISSAFITFEGEQAMLVVARDISERKKEETERERTLALLQATIEGSLNGILVIDTQANVLAHNRRFLDLWQLPADWARIEPAQKRFDMMYEHIKDRDAVYQNTQRLLVDMETEENILFHFINGKVINRYATPFRILGKLTGRLYTYEDTTERIRNEQRLRASEEKYRLLAENASDVIWTADLNGKFTYVSPSVKKLRGYSVEEVLRQTLLESLAPESLPEIIYAFECIQKTSAGEWTLKKLFEEIPLRYNLAQPCKNGDTIWTEVETSLMFDAQGKINGIQGVSRDITERRSYEKDLEAARRLAEERSLDTQEALHREKLLHNITRTISSSIEIDTILSELMRQVLEITKADLTQLGLLSEDSQSLHFQYSMNRDSSFRVEQIEPRNLRLLSWDIINNRRSLLLDSVAMMKARGIYTQDLAEIKATSLMGVPVMAGSSMLGVIGIISIKPGFKFSPYDQAMIESIASQAGIAIQNARLFSEVNLMAVTDPLTHLYNRRYFFNLANVELERSRRYEREFSIIMLDIDVFKRVNDTYGHLAGDEVLIQVANCVRQTIRQVDIAARYGGEEMVIMLPETTMEAARVTAERLRSKVEKLETKFNGKTISVTISLGVATLAGQTDLDTSKLLDHADQAMYIAKQTGRNRVEIYTVPSN